MTGSCYPCGLWPSTDERDKGSNSPKRAGHRRRASFAEVRTLRPTLRPGMGGVARADQMAIVKPSRLGLDHVADAAPRRHEVVDMGVVRTRRRA